MRGLSLLESRILIVDDQERNVMLLRAILDDNGYKNLYTITDSRKVISMVRDVQPDLILLDLMMPYLDGYTIMEQLHTLLPADQFLPILVLTADIRPEAKQRALSMGAKDFLTKPFDQIEVLLRIRNLLETRHLYTQLQNQNQELERAMQTKNEFLANMSHELRTPLNGILGLSELLLTNVRGPLNEKQQVYVNNIDASGRHLLSLINDILDLSKIEAGKLEVHKECISISEVCQTSLSFIKQSAIKKAIVIEYVADPLVTSIDADMRRLKQILVNLLGNAVKFTPPHGKIILNVKADPEQYMVDFSITDNGIGISAEDLSRLFTPFTQVDSSLTRQYEGTGLGLTLVKNLVELQGGSVRVQSEPGKGSTFIVSLPRKMDNAMGKKALLESEKSDTPTIQPEVQKSSSTILLAEDNEVNAMMVGDYLELRGYTVIYATNGREAIQKAHEYLPNLILLDIHMPIMDGLEAIRRLRGEPQFVNTPIIALTALAMTGDRERCLEAGATEYVSKPVNLKQLAGLITTLAN
ncbi:MAG: response regulator [Anaerolineales bacterium]|nr:response regulator [Anaerolineales bacterium]